MENFKLPRSTTTISTWPCSGKAVDCQSRNTFRIPFRTDLHMTVAPRAVGARGWRCAKNCPTTWNGRLFMRTAECSLHSRKCPDHFGTPFGIHRETRWVRTFPGLTQNPTRRLLPDING